MNHSFDSLLSGCATVTKQIAPLRYIFTKYWWLTLPAIYVGIHQWKRHRKTLPFEDAAVQTILDVTPTFTSLLALGLLLEHCQTSLPSQIKIIDVKAEKVA